MNQHPSALAAKVAAVNKANAEANRLYPILTEAIRPFIGKKILKADNSFTEAFKKVLPELPNWGNNKEISCYVSSGRGYNITLMINVSQGFTRRNGDFSTQSAEVVVYLADIEGQSLKSINPNYATERRTDYTEKEVFELREALDAAKARVSELNNSLYYFGEYEQNA